MKHSSHSRRFVPRRPVRAALWWARFRFSTGRKGWRSAAPVRETGFADVAAETVQSADALIASPFDGPRLWTARPVRTVRQPLQLLLDLCIDDPDKQTPLAQVCEPYESAPLQYLRIRDVLLLAGSGVVMHEPWNVLRETKARLSFDLSPLPGTTKESETARYRLERARPSRILDGPILSLCHLYSSSYGHWFTDCLAGVFDLLDVVRAGRLPLLARPLSDWQRRTLELLEVPSSAVVETDGNKIAITDLTCHSFPGRTHAAHQGPLTAEIFRMLRAASVKASRAPSPRLIYVSRRLFPTNRQFLDEKRIEEALAQLGFVVLHPQELTLDQQIAAFSRAEVVVGPHGAALANIGYAPPGCLVVSIFPGRGRPAWLFGMARQLEHRIVLLQARSQVLGTIESSVAHGHFLPRIYSIDAAVVAERVRVGMERLGIAPG